MKLSHVMLLIGGASMACIASCTDGPLGTDGDDTDGGIGTDATPPFPFVRCDDPMDALPPLVEDRRVYDLEALDVWTAELTIDDLEGFAEVNAGIDGAEVPVVFRQGDFGADVVAPNAVLRIRGGMSRENEQKNYKVELADGVGKWRGQKEINLNKHMWDLTRTRNKLAFEIFETIPDLTSLRTQFVHMFVNGEDFGLYTWIEEADKRFLASHGLDPDGQLYKAAAFHFQELDGVTSADPELMRAHIEPKANADPDKLLRMIAAVNDDTRDIDDVIDAYFNRDNLVTWLAVNVLVNNIDTRTQNYYLYSPSSCEGWYLLPWDYDGAFGFYAQLREDSRQRWESGLSNWWPSRLFKRFFTKPANVAAVHDKILELSSTALTDEVIAERLAAFHDLVQPYIVRMPDLRYLPINGIPTAEQAHSLWEQEMTRIGSTVSWFLAEYLAVVERPMPVNLDARVVPLPVRLRWKASFDLQHDPITYDVEISRTPVFAPGDVVLRYQDLPGTELYVPILLPGTYYWRVIVEDHKTGDSWQLPYHPYEMIVVP